MATMKIKVGDMVRVIAGADKGQEGKVQAVDHKKNRVVVEGLNMVSKHTKQSAQNTDGGIIKKEAPMDASNVMLVQDGKAVRVGFEIKDGRKVRVARNNGNAAID